ncbi:TPA: hypothetical protein N0F65_007701 [Lagenidium giganteum]|uniref:Uncharacterized protein n=1 Tax=Lagenidium giganteum TaxID=4803 RepID=A0AAV2Z494_9STRA|nr:TPA: hypothetical protein N0F65_007701 [Lagenidium giganteum]
MSVILDFGKYKGKTLEEFQDPSDDSYIMRWGKYKNKSIKWINENDKQYFGWLSHNEYVSKKCPSLSKDLIRVKQSFETSE